MLFSDINWLVANFLDVLDIVRVLQTSSGIHESWEPIRYQQYLQTYRFSASVYHKLPQNDRRYVCHLRSMESVLDIWPIALKTLAFDNEFDQTLDPKLLPAGLTHLTFGFWFNQPIDIKMLPAGLKYLAFGWNFCHPIHELPVGLTHLLVGWNFRSIYQLPISLTCGVYDSELGHPFSSASTSYGPLWMWGNGHDSEDDARFVVYSEAIPALRFHEQETFLETISVQYLEMPLHHIV